jgi:LDH2 family malate/lactate/ureidoglycolate dehydrogenase
MAFKPDLLAPADRFEQQVDALIAHVRATPRQPGVDAIRIPSERAFVSRERLSREGIELDKAVFDALSSL